MDINMHSCVCGLISCIVLLHVHCQTGGPVVAPDLGPDLPTFTTCSNMNCPPNSTCVDTGTYVYCDCAFGKTGVNCTMDDPCLETKEDCPPGMTCYGPCNPNVFCEGATGIPHCTNCLAGFKGNKCDEDEDECKEWEDACNFKGECTNTFGGYRCNCKLGYTGDYCEICQLSVARCAGGEEPSDQTSDRSTKDRNAAESLHIVPVTMALTLTFNFILTLLVL